jgi:hypothetical protein
MLFSAYSFAIHFVKPRIADYVIVYGDPSTFPSIAGVDEIFIMMLTLLPLFYGPVNSIVPTTHCFDIVQNIV